MSDDGVRLPLTGWRSVWIDKPLSALSHQDEMLWRTWLKRHGLPDPNDLPLCQHIDIDDVNRQVSCEVFVRDENLLVVWDEKSLNPLRRGVVVQLEAPALPVPGGYEVECG